MDVAALVVGGPTAALVVGTAILGLLLLVLLARRSGTGSKGGPPPSASQSRSSAAAPPLEDTRDKGVILFGTQTGTAERFAKSLRAQLEGKFGGGTAFEALDIEQYDAAARLPREKLVLLLMATYGDGDPTDSATEFWAWLSQAAESGEDPDQLQGVSFAVFGLGNRQYEHFCAMGSKVSKAMKALGAREVAPRGEGDDDKDIDADFDGWCGRLFGALDASPLVSKGGASLSADFLAAYDVEEVRDAPASAVDVLPAGGSGLNSHSPFLATVGAVRELHAGGGRSCVHVELDISGCQASYEAGDHVAVFAENSPAVVEAAARVLGLPLSHCFRMRLPSHNKHGLPEPAVEGPLTLRCALARCADLLSAPNKAALLALAACAKDAGEAARLQHLASIEGTDSYHEYVLSAKRSLLEVMQDFPSARPSLGAFFGSVAPHLQPRYYSISSAPQQHPRSVHITCAVVKERMPTGREHEGVASSWLAAAKRGHRIPIFLRHSTFKLPADPAVPVVMVGPGTGLSPFRGFLQHRGELARAGRKLGPAHLFFGCRNRKHDFIYEEELEAAVANGALSQLHVAFSRDKSQKEYVQHHMEAHAAEIWGLLCESGGYLYVCGDAGNMAKDVHRTLHGIAAQVTGCTDAQAEAAVKKLSDSGRYLKDVW
ncbi:NADPH-cytochrome P450 reductase isoform A [Micractinium conductrix]|uniref:NADPH--hemoprotein reductase n=1 Tax=Micractinium conductrix TaxID=554055 RepID=A0A2P6VB46_9CHLO|nr:NADPH-cytochrome P450 reductase isoform A [Micractinium conductrix]|eukprot:PSC71305.1 NADPH-cytochrome P450 reductase isoform A [Micractinium conductrix]